MQTAKCKVCLDNEKLRPHPVNSCNQKICFDCTNILKIQKCKQCFKKIERSVSHKKLIDSNLITRPSTSQRLLRQEFEKSINETRILNNSTQFDNKSIRIASLLLFNYDKIIKTNQYDHIAYTNKVKTIEYLSNNNQ